MYRHQLNWKWTTSCLNKRSKSIGEHSIYWWAQWVNFEQLALCQFNPCNSISIIEFLPLKFPFLSYHLFLLSCYTHMPFSFSHYNMQEMLFCCGDYTVKQGTLYRGLQRDRYFEYLSLCFPKRHWTLLLLLLLYWERDKVRSSHAGSKWKLHQFMCTNGTHITAYPPSHNFNNCTIYHYHICFFNGYICFFCTVQLVHWISNDEYTFFFWTLWDLWIYILLLWDLWLVISLYAKWFLEQVG